MSCADFYERADAAATGSVVLCANCDRPVSRRGAGRSPTGWLHWGPWHGIRCPGRLTGAVPGRGVAWPP